MVVLKNKIRKVNSLPPSKEKSNKIIINILNTIFIIIITFVFYKYYIKYIHSSIDINKISGKKIFINECNTKDYIIINKDKSYSLSITDDNCNINYYEGDLKIKGNKMIFNKNIKGQVDSNNNIIINNNLFSSESNE